MFSHIIQKVSARAFHLCGWRYAYVEKLPKYVLSPFKFHSQSRYGDPKTGVLFLLCSQGQTKMLLSKKSNSALGIT